MSGDRKSLVRHTQCVVTVCNFFTVWTCPVSHPATLPSTKRPKPPIGFLFVPFKPSSPSPSSTSPMSSYSNIRDCKSFLKPESKRGSELTVKWHLMLWLSRVIVRLWRREARGSSDHALEEGWSIWKCQTTDLNNLGLHNIVHGCLSPAAPFQQVEGSLYERKGREDGSAAPKIVEAVGFRWKNSSTNLKLWNDCLDPAPSCSRQAMKNGSLVETVEAVGVLDGSNVWPVKHFGSSAHDCLHSAHLLPLCSQAVQRGENSFQPAKYISGGERGTFLVKKADSTNSSSTHLVNLIGFWTL